MNSFIHQLGVRLLAPQTMALNSANETEIYVRECVKELTDNVVKMIEKDNIQVHPK